MRAPPPTTAEPLHQPTSPPLVADAEERVRHLALGASGPDAAVANALEDAAVTARSRGAWGTAGELLELARRSHPPASATPHPAEVGECRRAPHPRRRPAPGEGNPRGHSRRRTRPPEPQSAPCACSARSNTTKRASPRPDRSSNVAASTPTIAASRALVHLDLAFVWAASDIEAAAEHAAPRCGQASSATIVACLPNALPSRSWWGSWAATASTGHS